MRGSLLDVSWELEYRNIEIWGTVISIIIPTSEYRATSNRAEAFENACASATQFYREIDSRFSTYKEDSEVCKIRTGRLEIKDASPDVKLVWNRTFELREFTQRAFDPWAVPGGFDPSGYVKGWAAEQSLRFFAEAGFERIQINAGGDIVLRGGYDSTTPWHIGIRHPDLPDEIAKSFEIFDGAIASSGTYERGEHVIDPRVGVPAVGAQAATVIGPDAGIADALATAVIVDGRDSVNWLGNSAFRSYQFWAVDKYGDGAWSYNNAE
jgi:thiamine biosynthesis lipoprotein